MVEGGGCLQSHAFAQFSQMVDHGGMQLDHTKMKVTHVRGSIYKQLSLCNYNICKTSKIKHSGCFNIRHVDF